MPVIQIRYNRRKIGDKAIRNVVKNIPGVASRCLSCEEGGRLAEEDIMVEVDHTRKLDKNCKDVNVRVLAHDYEERRDHLQSTRSRISKAVRKHLPKGASWYVWVILANTSYGSDSAA